MAYRFGRASRRRRTNRAYASVDLFILRRVLPPAGHFLSCRCCHGVVCLSLRGEKRKPANLRGGPYDNHRAVLSHARSIPGSARFGPETLEIPNKRSTSTWFFSSRIAASSLRNFPFRGDNKVFGRRLVER